MKLGGAVVRLGASVAALLPVAIFAQAPKDAAPLKYWLVPPLYWQPGASGLPTKTATFGVEAERPAQAPANSLAFVGMTPCRVADTRTGFGFTGPFGPPSLMGGATRAFPIQASTTCSIPSIAQAYSFNLTVVTSKFLNYLTIWPVGSTQPNASTLNDDLGTVVANAAIVPAGNDMSGSVNVFASNNTDLIIDINGYYAPQNGITLAQGSASAPSLSFMGEATTGIFSQAAGTVSIVSNGVSRFTVKSNGELDIPGSILKNGSRFLSNLGTSNTAVGIGALGSNTTGSFNAAFGSQALAGNTTGTRNTASGANALQLSTTGSSNTATGNEALANNTIGNNNTASGFQALNGSATGNMGNNNTAIGTQTVYSNTTGGNNTAFGVPALYSNTTGNDNLAAGVYALAFNTTGNSNTSSGYEALISNTTGSNNIALGATAGFNLSGARNNNILIGHMGTSGDSNLIRMGSLANQSSFFAAGIRGITTGMKNAVPLLIDGNGQLGTVSSSARFKQDIRDMGDASSGLLQLRPVTFRYRQPYADASKPVDYGLIAEEVAQIYPDLVARDASGTAETVQYQRLTPMLLNELRKERARAAQQRLTIDGQAVRIAQQQMEIWKQDAQLDQQNGRMTQQNAQLEEQAEALRRLQAELAGIGAILGKMSGAEDNGK